MTEERDGDSRWSERPEDERLRHLRALWDMLTIGASRFRAEQRRRQKEAELLELRRVSQAADTMCAGVPAKRKGRART